MGPHQLYTAKPVPFGESVEKSGISSRKGGAAGRGVHGRGAASSAAAQTLDRRVSCLFVRGGRTNRCRGDACVAPTTPGASPWGNFGPMQCRLSPLTREPGGFGLGVEIPGRCGTAARTLSPGSRPGQAPTLPRRRRGQPGNAGVSPASLPRRGEDLLWELDTRRPRKRLFLVTPLHPPASVSPLSSFRPPSSFRRKPESRGHLSPRPRLSPGRRVGASGRDSQHRIDPKFANPVPPHIR